MKSHPILFSAPMVRAILAGQKTQTRRFVRGQVPAWENDNYRAMCLKSTHCPYGQPGDQLWVREAWRIGAWDCDTGGIAIDYPANDFPRREWFTIPNDVDGEIFNRYWEQSCRDCETANWPITEDGGYKWEPGQSPCRLRPSIHMPRWASRITLEVTGVRVERLQDLSEQDAYAEGAGCNADGYFIETFKEIWESINSAFSWDANPWVWVVEFRMVKP